MDIYIYGAGVYGKQCYEQLVKLGFSVKGFVVTNLDANPQNLFNLQVIDINLFSKKYRKSLLIIALKKKYKEEVIQLLSNKNITNYQCFVPNGCDFIKNKTTVPNIYIYGAGKYGERCLEILHSLGFHAKSFIVTDIKKNSSTVKNIPVIEWSECKDKIKSSIIIVALSEKFRNEVVDLLKSAKTKYYQVFNPNSGSTNNNGLTVAHLLNEHFKNIQPIDNIHISSDKRRINLVTDSISKNSLFGGVATAIIVAVMFAKENKYTLRVITRHSVSDPEDLRQILQINNLDDFTDIEFYSEVNASQKLEISSSDVFFATSWWSAAAIKKMTIRKRFFYIIQEVETFFYPHGEEHYLCSRIMEDENIDFIINSNYLNDYFLKNTPNISKNGVFFNPAFSNKLYKINKFTKKTKYNLFFYARPRNPRNMFYYGIYLLEKAIQMGVLNTDEWDIFCAGQETPMLFFSNGYKAINKGLMDWKQYGEFLGDIDLTLSLMYTPHPSYPPYDAACAGSVVITNECLNKIEFPECKNVIMSDLEEHIFLQKMQEAIKLAKDMKQRKVNFEQSTISHDWYANLRCVMTFMSKKIECN